MNIDVVNKTTLTGAVIASTTGDLTLATGSLEYSNIKDRNSSTNFGGGASLTYGDEIKRDSSGRKIKNEKGEYVTETGLGGGADSASYGFSDSRQTNFATIGEGTIIVRDTSASLGAGGTTDLSGLNRDVSKAQYSTMDIGVQLEADKTTLSAITNPLDTYQDTVEGLGQIAERGRKIEAQTHIVEKTGNLIEHNHFTTDDKVETYLSMDDYEEKIENGEPVSAWDKVAYYKSRVAVGEPLSAEEQLDCDNAKRVVIKEVSDKLKQDILDTRKTSTNTITKAKVELLNKIDPEAAAEVSAMLARLKAEEKRQQLIKESQYIADFKALDRAKTDEYIASQGSGIASSLIRSEQDKSTFEIINGLGLSRNKIYDETGMVIGEQPSEDAVAIAKFAQRVLNPCSGLNVNAPTIFDSSTELKDLVVNAIHEKEIEASRDSSRKTEASGWKALGILIDFSDSGVSLASSGIIVGIEKKTAENLSREISENKLEKAIINEYNGKKSYIFDKETKIWKPYTDEKEVWSAKKANKSISDLNKSGVWDDNRRGLGDNEKGLNFKSLSYENDDWKIIK